MFSLSRRVIATVAAAAALALGAGSVPGLSGHGLDTTAYAKKKKKKKSTTTTTRAS